MLLWYYRQWAIRWKDCDGVETRCCPKDSRKLPLSLYRREGFRIQGIFIPPGHSQLHVSRWWLHKPQRNWWKINLRKQVRRWKLSIEAYRTRNPLHGQCWSQHQRFAVFLVYRQNVLVGWKACCFRFSCWRHGSCQEGRILWIPIRKNFGKDHRCWLWTIELNELKNKSEVNE